MTGPGRGEAEATGASHVGTKTRADFDALVERCRNWGRWGPDDELGTLNHVTPERLAAAAREIVTGERCPLGIELGASGPQRNATGARFNPIHLMLASGADQAPDDDPDAFRYADDVLILPLQAATQWDALSHVFCAGRMWNGHDMTLVGTRGAQRNSIVAASGRLMGRGVLLDVAGTRGVDVLAPGAPVHAAELDAVAAAEGVDVRPGDFVLVRTGWLGHHAARGWVDHDAAVAPGLALDTAWWLQEHEVAAVASDTGGCEVKPSEIEGLTFPWHRIVIANQGLSVGEWFALDDLARVCRRLGRHSFFLSATGLPVTGAVGTPTQPVAVF